MSHANRARRTFKKCLAESEKLTLLLNDVICRLNA